MGSPIDETMPYRPDKRIWRYMDLAKYLDLLRTRSLYLSSLAAFEDAWEGATGAYDLERDAMNYQHLLPGQAPEDAHEFARVVEAHAEQARALVYVSCWHANDSESAAMWRLYGATGQAIAIESTIERLAEVGPDSPETEGPSSVMAVRYFDLTRDSLPHEDAFNLLARHTYKRPAFRHEEEIRLVHYLLDTSRISVGENQIAYELAPKGRAFRADLQRLVNRVVVSPEAPSWYRDVVIDATQKYGFAFSVDESDMLVCPSYGNARYPAGPAPHWGPEGRFGLPQKGGRS